MVLPACGEREEERPGGAQKAASARTGSLAPLVAVRQLGRPETVSGQANIFGAGRKYPPAPAGGGPGVRPPVWRLPEGSDRIVTFPRTAGRVNPIVGGADDNGAAGDRVGATDVTSYRGLSGIVHRRNGMFLTGVFLAGDPPAGGAPPRLNFTGRERFERLAPRIGQTFFIGDGQDHSYRVPSRAIRLFLGFADGYLYKGAPGWYGNNSGELSVTVDMSSG